MGLLIDCAVRDDDASVTAEVLIDGDLRGYRGHGLQRLADIIPALRAGSLDPSAAVTCEVGRGGGTIFDAHGGLGPPAAAQAVDAAAAAAHLHGIGFAGVRNGGHIGVLGWYTERAARRNCFAVAGTTTSPATVVAGGRTPVLGTNPIAFSFVVHGEVVTADFSTAAISRSSLLEAAGRRTALPERSAVDRNGVETRDALEALAGGLLPYGGGLKGSLFGLLVALLAGPVIGAPPNHEVAGTRDLSRPPSKGDFVMCIDLQDSPRFDADVAGLLSAMAADSATFRWPGSRSASAKRRAVVEVAGSIYTMLEPWLAADAAPL